jgi:hypothetical protein
MVSLTSRAHNTGGEISWGQFARETKFLFKVAPKICESPVRRFVSSFWRLEF